MSRLCGRAGKGTLDDDELDEEARAEKLRRLEAEEEAEAQHMVEEEVGGTHLSHHHIPVPSLFYYTT